MRRSSVLPCLLGAFTFATAFLALSNDAHAARRVVYERGGGVNEYDEGLSLGFDGDVVFPLKETNIFPDPTGSFGADVRVGWRAKAGPIFIQPEALVGLQEFATGGVRDETMGRGMVGARLGLRGILQPQAIFHIGYGGSQTYGGFTYDAGGGLDVHLRRWSFGIHATFNGLIDKGYMLKWIDIGPNFGVTF